jgi:hypothetical protein
MLGLPLGTAVTSVRWFDRLRLFSPIVTEMIACLVLTLRPQDLGVAWPRLRGHAVKPCSEAHPRPEDMPTRKWAWHPYQPNFLSLQAGNRMVEMSDNSPG